MTDSSQPEPAPSALAGRHLPSWALMIGATLFLLTFDLVSKSLAFKWVADTPVVLSGHNPAEAVPPHEAIRLVPYVLSLKLTLNTGAVFGLGKGAQWLFVVVSFLAVLVIVRVFWASPAGARGTHLSLTLILAGALGNLHDRIRFNAVRDLLWLFPDSRLPFAWHWPGGRDELYPWIFNVADASLVAGVALMLILMWRGPKRGPGDRKFPG